MQFFQELHSHIDKNSGEKSEDMFLVKIASKGTSLINPFFQNRPCQPHANIMAVNVSSEDSSPLNLSAHLIFWVQEIVRLTVHLIRY